MNIATALNRKYLEYTVVMLCSLCENNNEHIDAYLLHSELTTQDIDIIKNSLSKYDITIISVEINKSDFDDRLPRNTQWSIETYYRLMLMDILPESVDRLMYLDVDAPLKNFTTLILLVMMSLPPMTVMENVH